MAEEYIPFGKEWVDANMQMKKADIVEILKVLCKENVRLKQRISEFIGEENRCLVDIHKDDLTWKIDHDGNLVIEEARDHERK